VGSFAVRIFLDVAAVEEQQGSTAGAPEFKIALQSKAAITPSVDEPPTLLPMSFSPSLVVQTRSEATGQWYEIEMHGVLQAINLEPTIDLATGMPLITASFKYSAARPVPVLSPPTPPWQLCLCLLRPRPPRWVVYR
jgi:hypothetical protein